VPMDQDQAPGQPPAAAAAAAAGGAASAAAASDAHMEAIYVPRWKRRADADVVNSVAPHPHLPILASSGIDSDIKYWSPRSNPVPPQIGESHRRMINIQRLLDLVRAQGFPIFDLGEEGLENNPDDDDTD
jgi:hypothetical protein